MQLNAKSRQSSQFEASASTRRNLKRPVDIIIVIPRIDYCRADMNTGQFENV